MPSKILIVEDDKNLNMMLKLILKNKQLDWDLQSANNGVEAMKLLDSFKPDAVLLDVMMPEMDGLEVCKRIKKDPKYARTRVAILTALTDAETRDKAMSSGANEFWTKPIMPDTLLTNLQKLLK